jgi:predicted membrane protein
VSLNTNFVTCDHFTAVKIADWLFVSVCLWETTYRDILYYEILSELEALIVAIIVIVVSLVTVILT